MFLLLVTYLAGVLTILSPCILPVLPFVFASNDAGQSFFRSRLPLLGGMAISFAAVATLASIGGGWAVKTNHVGRIAAMVLLALFGISLLQPALATRLTRPLVSLGSHLSQRALDRTKTGKSIWSFAMLGVATGLLWAPCAGPILGLVLTGAALKGASIGTSFLLLAYASGAATSLAAALFIGGHVLRVMKRSLGVGEWIRRATGITVLAGVAAIALGLDSGLLTRISLAGTSNLEQGLIDGLAPRPANTRPDHPTPGIERLPIIADAPPLAGAVEWINSAPLTSDALRGKVVIVDFWTYSCINCLRSIPYVRSWAAKYRDKGLVVIGVHAPEFAFEKDIANVRRAVTELKIDYPVAVDNDYAIWRSFNNQYWPAHYLIDAHGKIRETQFGEGSYDETETAIQQLLAEAGQQDLPTDRINVTGRGAQAEADLANMRSPETYLGYTRASNFASTGGEVADTAHLYNIPGTIALNQWALAGEWTVGGENATLHNAGGIIAYRFHARDLHLVLGPSRPGQVVHFRVSIDGQPPREGHGADIDENGNGVVSEQRLYQLVRQHGPITDHDFRIEFLDPDVQAYAFTFG